MAKKLTRADVKREDWNRLWHDHAVEIASGRVQVLDLGVSGVFDYAGPNRNSCWRSCSCCLPRITKSSASGFTVFGAGYPPRLYPCLRFAAYLAIGLAQNSGPSGSLLLSREDSSSSASCRFSPAHCNCLVRPTDKLQPRKPALVIAITVQKSFFRPVFCTK
jgi:hypothetical protein